MYRLRQGRLELGGEIMRGIAAVATLLLLATGADAGAQNGTEHAEFWPELQFRYRIDDANSATLVSRLRLTTGPAQMYRAKETLTFSHTFAEWLSGGAGFEHRNSTNATPFEEERAIVNQTLRIGLPNDFRVEFRTQEEFRWLLTGFSVRLRERAQALRTVRMEGYSFTPYGQETEPTAGTSRRLSMVIAQEPAQSLAAPHRSLALPIDFRGNSRTLPFP